MDSSLKTGRTFAISHGFLGGPLHNRRLCKLLVSQGFTFTQKIAAADIIIAHSAGCWLIPESAAAKLVIFIGMPLKQEQPGRIFRKANRNNIWLLAKEFRFIRSMSLGMLSIYYGFRYPRRNINIARRVGTAQAVMVPSAFHVFIANRYDPWPYSAELDKLLIERDWAFLGLPGSHDDIWQHPDRYAPIIDHYAKLLA